MKNKIRTLSLDDLSNEMEILESNSKKKIIGGRDPSANAETLDGGNDSGGGFVWTGGNGPGRISLDGFSSLGDSLGFTKGTGSAPSTGQSSSAGTNTNSGYLLDNIVYTSASGNPYAKVSFDGGQTWTNEAIVQINTGAPGWQSALNALLGVGEIAIGALGAVESGGVTTFLIVDGATRVGTNVAELLKPGAGASNLGGLIGRAVDGQNGQKWGEMINDGATAVISGGALSSTLEAAEAINACHAGQGAYFILDAANSAYQYGHQ